MMLNWTKIQLIIVFIYGQALALYPDLATSKAPGVIMKAWEDGTFWPAVVVIILNSMMARLAFMRREVLFKRKQKMAPDAKESEGGAQ